MTKWRRHTKRSHKRDGGYVQNVFVFKGNLRIQYVIKVYETTTRILLIVDVQLSREGPLKA